MKKNFRFVPEYLIEKTQFISTSDIQVLTAKKITLASIEQGDLKHLGIELNNGKLTISESVIPPETSGKYSKRNIHGNTIKRRDLPKESFTISMEPPNWKGSGTHTVTITNQRYQKEFIAPHTTSILVNSDCIEKSGYFTITFRIDAVLQKTSHDFSANLLRCINLMQENVGCVDIISSDKTLSDYLGTLVVGWEILPPGSRDQAYDRIFKGRAPTQVQIDQFDERYKFLKSLNPQKEIFGSSGMNRYLGAKINDNLVVFENLTYGNAIYVMYDQWEVLSKHSRIELLSGKLGKNFDRVPHFIGWKDKVNKLIASNC